MSERRAERGQECNADIQMQRKGIALNNVGLGSGEAPRPSQIDRYYLGVSTNLARSGGPVTITLGNLILLVGIGVPEFWLFRATEEVAYSDTGYSDTI